MSVPTPILQYNLSDASVKGLLPSGYTPLAYVEFPGSGAGIDLGYKFNALTDSYEIEFLAVSNTGQNGMILASNGAKYSWLYYYNTAGIKIYITDSNGSLRNSGNGPNDLHKHIVRYHDRKWYIDRGDSSAAGTYESYSFVQDTNNLCLGDYSTSQSYPFKGKIYRVKIWRNDILLRDLIPASHSSGNGYYDLVTRTFYTRTGLIAGPELAVGKGGGKSLPEEYLLVEYLESTGALYIITNFIPDDTSGMYVKASCSTTGGNHVIGGSRESSGDTRFWINFSSNLELSWNTYASIYSYDSSVLEIENNYLNSRLGKVNGTTYRTNYPTLATITQPCYLFCSNMIGVATNHFSGKIFNAKFSKNSTIVRNFIPCYRKSDMKPGMYDTVNGVFYTNAGSGEFILGPSITNCYTWEPNAGSGTLLGFYTNLSGIYDSSKGWVAGFNGSSSTVKTGLNFSLYSSNFSIVCWLKSNVNNGGYLTAAGNELSNGGIVFGELQATNKLQCYLNGTSGSDINICAYTSFAANTWYHVVYTVQNALSSPVAKLYINGSLITTSSGSAAFGEPELPIIIGCNGTYRFWNGQISNFLIFNIALTDAQVKELYGK